MPIAQNGFRRTWYITLAHTAVDFYMTLCPPLLALFKARFGLSLVQVSLIPTFVSVCGSIPQPLMGYFADRRNRVALTALGLAVCGVCVSAIGFAPSAPVLALFLVMSAFGSSLFHPTGASLVTAFAPGRANFALSIFLTGGTLGMAISPVTGTQIVERYGLESFWVLMFPGLALSLLLLWKSKGGKPDSTKEKPERIGLSLLRTGTMRPLLLLYVISVLRYLSHSGYVNFTSLLGEERGWSTGRIGWILSGFLISSMLGRVVGGYLGDRVSPRKLLALSSVLSAPFFVGFTAFDSNAALPLYFVAGFIFDMGLSTNIVLAQRILPKNTSAATGLVMGFSWATSGALIPLVGLLAEAFSVAFALACVSAFLLPAALLVAALPDPREAQRVSEAAVGTD